MAICKICGQSVTTGAVVHPECLPEWISVEDKLPESADSMVLAVVDGKYNNITFCHAVQIASYDGMEWGVEGFPLWDDPHVSYWMPLPEPPEVDLHAGF